jgi:hypothetical protein
MHKNVTTLVLIYFLIFQTVYSYGQSKRLKLSEIAISYGLQKDIYNDLTFNDYKSIAPNSEIFSNANSNYSYHNQALNNSYFNSNFYSNFFLGNIGLSHEKYKNGLFRIGFHYFFKHDQFSTYAYQSNFIGNDTVFTNQGTPVYLDIYRSKKIIANSSSKKILFDLSYIHKLPEEHQIVMYSGFGFLMGIGYQSILKTSYDEIIGPSGLNQYAGSTVSYNREELKIKPYLLSSVYIPLGLDIKLGKKNNFMNRIHLFLEIRPAISLIKFPTAKSIPLISGNTNLGVKVSF